MASLLRAAPLCGDPAPRAPSFPRGAASCRLRARSPNFPVRLSAPRSRLQFPPPGRARVGDWGGGAEPTPCAPPPTQREKARCLGRAWSRSGRSLTRRVHDKTNPSLQTSSVTPRTCSGRPHPGPAVTFDGFCSTELRGSCSREAPQFQSRALPPAAPSWTPATRRLP